MTDQKKQAAIEVSELKGRNEDLRQKIRKLKHKVALGAVAAGVTQRARTHQGDGAAAKEGREP
jgi:hypothetical protein